MDVYLSYDNLADDEENIMTMTMKNWKERESKNY